MFRNSWRVGALAGVDLKIHVTFPPVVAPAASRRGTAHGAACGAVVDAARGFLGLVSTADLAEALAGAERAA